MSLRELEEVLVEKAGPLPQFTIYHAVKALELIGEERVGRIALSRRLGIGEGSVRTLLTKMKNAGLVKADRRGCWLTEKGRKLLEGVRERVAKGAPLEAEIPQVGGFAYAIRVRGVSKKVKAGMEQRDEAVRAGARGALVLVQSGGRLILPPNGPELVEVWPEGARELLSKFELGEGDVVIVCGADSRELSEYGAYMAALSLIDC